VGLSELADGLPDRGQDFFLRLPLLRQPNGLVQRAGEVGEERVGVGLSELADGLLDWGQGFF
jgi:hypothetical protein